MTDLSVETLAELRSIGDRFAAAQLEEVRQIRDRLAEAEVASLYRSYRLGTKATRDPAMGGKFVYAEVSLATVSPEVRRAAARAVAWAVKDNSLAFQPEVGWFVPENDGDRAYVARWGQRDWRWSAKAYRIDGWCVPALGQLWLSAGIPMLGVIRTAAHEVRHLSQDDPYSAVAERDARAYEDRVEGAICAQVIA